MTPARKKALQWFHDRGEVRGLWRHDDSPSPVIVEKMIREGLLDQRIERYGRGPSTYALTDKGRRALNGDAE